MQNASAAWGSKAPSIIYEDADVLVVNKPVGLVAHSDGRTAEPTLAEWLVEKYPAIKAVGEPWTAPDGTVMYRPGIVHRLDRDTSGVMIVAKTQAAFEFLKKQFQNHEVQKTYHAFVYGHLKEKLGVIDKPIGRSPVDFRRWSAQPGARGEMREAQTSWSVLKEGTDAESGEEVAYLELRPKTGRTHQLRVHLKAIHHPIIADSLYAEGKPQLLGFTRTALHAKAIEVTLPNGKKSSFEAPFPPDFERAIAILG